MRRSVTALICLALYALLAYSAIAVGLATAGVNNPPKYFPLTNVYNSGGNVSCPPTATWADVQLFGGSGGGGGSSATLGGGGGGPGAFEECLFPCSSGAMTLILGTGGLGGFTGGSCGTGLAGTDTSMFNFNSNCLAKGGGGAVAAGCAGGLAFGHTENGPVGFKLGVQGANGLSGSGTNGGAGGMGPNPGGNGGNAGQNAQSGKNGFAIVTFF